MFHLHRLNFLCAVFVVLAVGCSEKQTVQTTPNAVLPTIDSEGATAPSISDAEALEFALQWETAVGEGNFAAASQLIMFNRIADRALENFDVDDAFLKGVRSGLTKGQPIANLVRQLNQECNEGGSYLLVRTAVRGNDQHAIFRLVGSDSSINYHDLRLTRDGGSMRADQFFIAATGEALSDTLRTAVTPAIASQQSVLGRLDGSAKRSINELQKQKDMMQAARSGDSVKANQIYETLSVEAKATKITQLARIMAADIEDEANYLKVFDEYARSFPNDPSLALIALDAAIIREDPEQLNKCYKAIQEWTGGDDYIGLMIGSVMAKIGDVKTATDIYSKVDIKQLQLADMHDFALGLNLGTQNHQAVLSHLRILRDDFGFEFEDLVGAEGFENFVASEQHKEWLADSPAGF